MASCPCCSNSMLRHIQSHEVHWFCRTCWVKMPLIEARSNILPTPVQELSIPRQNHRQKNAACLLLETLS